MTPARITIRSRGTAPEADNREQPEKERAKATVKALALQPRCSRGPVRVRGRENNVARVKAYRFARNT